MANRFPLVVDDVIKELPSGDNLDLTGSGIVNAGAVAATSIALGGVSVSADANDLNILDGVTATTAELNYLDIAALGTSAASKAVTADANGVVRFSAGIAEKVVALTNLDKGSDLIALGVNCSAASFNPAMSFAVGKYSFMYFDTLFFLS